MRPNEKKNSKSMRAKVQIKITVYIDDNCFKNNLKVIIVQQVLTLKIITIIIILANYYHWKKTQGLEGNTRIEEP